MTEQTQLNIEEVKAIVDDIHDLMNRCIKLTPRAGEYRTILQTVVADLLKAYYDMLLLYIYIKM